jgi:S-adenosylmethionine decarboxylase
MQGLHLICDARDCVCNTSLLCDPAALQQLCESAVQQAGLQRVNALFHKFSPEPDSGVTGIVLLAESHLAVHTWPELNAVTLDVYACNYGRDNSDAARAVLKHLLHAFGATHIKIQKVLRGMPAELSDS